MQLSQIIAENNIDNLLEMARTKFEVVFEDVVVGPYKMQILQIADLENYVDRLAEESKEKIELPFWAKIWPASILLSHYLTSLPAENGNKSIMELGSGIGLTGLFAARHGFNVILSDNNLQALLFAKINILKNNLQDKARIECVNFTTERLKQKFEYIVGSEIFYKENSYRGLIKFLLTHINSSPASEVLLAADYRRQAKKFFQAAQKEFRIDQKNIG
ncbi:MAG: methyltransferase, partial [Desulfonatronovibrio sp.]|nr:protein N-lysine methyltransferase family protein [Desulfovibrionales bacterium]